jgi:ADP-L-glycero-D-manno-heptose 6-epimerase
MILLTGHKGFIGRNLQRYFDFRGKKVYGLDAKDGDIFLQLSCVPWSEITEIYHQGAISQTTELNVDKIYNHNIKFSIDLFTRASEYNIPVKYASSGSVYGNTMGKYLSPLNYYAMSKMTIDLWVQDNISKFRNIVGFRYFNVYGADEQKDDYSTSPIYRYSEQAKNGGIIEFFSGSENTYRDFICVEDLINIITREHKSGIYDLGTTKSISFLDVVELVAYKYNAKIKFVPFPDIIKGRYQLYTQAKEEGYEYDFLSVEDWLKIN